MGKRFAACIHDIRGRVSPAQDVNDIRMPLKQRHPPVVVRLTIRTCNKTTHRPNVSMSACQHVSLLGHTEQCHAPHAQVQARSIVSIAQVQARSIVSLYNERVLLAVAVLRVSCRQMRAQSECIHVYVD